jgi:hypothetical protein
MDSLELIQLALETLPWVSVQAVCSGVETGDVKAGELGTELFLVASEIDSPGYQICDQRLRQLKELLHLVDKACSVSYPDSIVKEPVIWLMLSYSQQQVTDSYKC